MNTRKIIPPILKYLRELSVIVVGIFITFYISSSIEKRKEQKDLNFYLETIKEELKDNLNVVDNHIDYYGNNLKFRNILLDTPYKDIPVDSVIKYRNYIFTDQYYTTSDYAWQIFKASGKMDLIEDKKLLLDIMLCYRDMESLNSFSEGRHNAKTELVRNLYNIMMEGHADIYNPRNMPKEVKNIFDHIKSQNNDNNAEYYGCFDCKKRIEELIPRL